ncbi:lysophospholipid acyltransferase family protein [Terribacillus sp. DMT04]|uniref:lysophospholipid acyltransferase family protein n=1 Tax=Terribacillus sp. DMT04 TaxID=2850441 RepID=UPI001C2BDE5F|nr:lysophospholipid acyltransferase family protein [Terribacillus sp. DMT04]QXE00235.1 lysophospholipid acyltransferase family protein [Terribacillus sp. DMT04]
MIQAEKKRWFIELFAAYQKYYLLPRHFDRVEATGVVQSPVKPAIFIANHSSWWDGLLVFQATERLLKGNHYMMMAQKGMEEHRFFRKLGAFSVDKQKIRDVLISLHYARQLLESGNHVWLFPQGEILHQDKRPYLFQTGIGYLLQQSDCPVVPVTLHYYFGEKKKPSAALHFGEPITEDWQNMTRDSISMYLSKILEDQADMQKQTIIGGSNTHPQAQIS